MGFFDKIVGEVFDDALGFVEVPQPGVQAGRQPPVATTDPATNNVPPTAAPAQTSYDEVKSYLAAKAQQAYIKAFTKEPEYGAYGPPAPTFLQTEEGQKMIKFGIIGFIAWLFLVQG